MASILTDDHDSNGYESAEEDRSMMKSGKIALGLTRRYLRGKWKGEHGFREMAQNCVDGILESYHITREQLVCHVEHSNDDFLARFTSAVPASRQQTLGWIYFDVPRGILHLTNCDAALPRAFLEIGHSTKSGGSQAAGGYGEGAKVGALAFCREDYQFEYVTSNFKWRFIFGTNRNGDSLYCSTTPISGADRKRLSSMQSALHRKYPFIHPACPDLDISVRIGNVYEPGRNKQKGKKVTRADFSNWKKYLLYLNNPTKLDAPSYGSILWDKSLGGTIYLKGLLVQSSRSSVRGGKQLKHGYNISNGEVGRDRDMLSNEEELAKTLVLLNDAALNDEKEGSSPLLRSIIATLRDPQHRYSDLDLAEKFAPLRFAQRVWKVLEEEATWDGTFYYSNQADHENDIIRHDLKKVPVQIPEKIFKLLRNHQLIRTPSEQMKHYLLTAKDSERAETKYFAGVKRSFAAALALDALTEHLTQQWKGNVKGEQDLLVDDNIVLINDKHGCFRTSHGGLPCTLSMADQERVDTTTFTCDHIIIYFYGAVIRSLRAQRQSSNMGLVEDEDLLRARLSEKLNQMPRLVRASPADAREIMVTWADKESALASRVHGLDLTCCVTLHRESTCSDKRYQIIAESQDQAYSQSDQHAAECGCPKKILPFKEQQVLFSDLSFRENYFPMIATTEPRAFYGEPPVAIHPGAQGQHFQSKSTSPQKESRDFYPAYGKTYPPTSSDDGGDSYQGVSDGGLDDDCDNDSEDSRSDDPPSAECLVDIDSRRTMIIEFQGKEGTLQYELEEEYAINPAVQTETERIQGIRSEEVMQNSPTKNAATLVSNDVRDQAATIRDLEEQVTTLQEQLDRRESEISNRHREIEDAHEMKRLSEDQVAEALGEVQILQQEIETAAKEIRRLSEKLEKSEAFCHELMQDIENYQLPSQMDSESSQATDKSYDSNTAAVDDLHRQIETLRNGNDELQSNIKNAESTMTAIREKIDGPAGMINAVLATGSSMTLNRAKFVLLATSSALEEASNITTPSSLKRQRSTDGLTASSQTEPKKQKSDKAN